MPRNQSANTSAHMAFNLRKVLISDDVAPECIRILQAAGIEVVFNPKLKHQELLDTVRTCDGLIVRSATKVTAEVIAAGGNQLKVIGRAGTGVDNIDLDAATGRGVLVLNTPAGNTLSAAEQTCALIASLARHIPQACASMREGKWDRKKYTGNELMGKTLAIIGLGRIGKEVATRMQSFGMRTIGYDPITPAETAATFNVEWMPLESIWPLADFITVHVPLIPQTKNLISTATLAKCKRGVRVINVARGGIIDEAELLEALKSGQCGGAALDVFVNEPPTAESLDLIRHPLAVTTPHLGASTEEAQIRVAEEIAQAFVDLATGKALNGAVNGHVLVQAISHDVQPWVELAQTLGRALASIEPSAKKIHLLACSSLQRNGGFLEAAVSSGFLSAAIPSSGRLNLVNASAVAKREGLHVTVEFTDQRSGLTIRGQQADSKQISGVPGPFLVAFGDSVLRSPLKLIPGSRVAVVDGRSSTSTAGTLQELIQHGASVAAFSDSEDGGRRAFLLTAGADNVVGLAGVQALLRV